MIRSSFIARIPVNVTNAADLFPRFLHFESIGSKILAIAGGLSLLVRDLSTLRPRRTSLRVQRAFGTSTIPFRDSMFRKVDRGNNACRDPRAGYMRTFDLRTFASAALAPSLDTRFYYIIKRSCVRPSLHPPCLHAGGKSVILRDPGE